MVNFALHRRDFLFLPIDVHIQDFLLSVSMMALAIDFKLVERLLLSLG